MDGRKKSACKAFIALTKAECQQFCCGGIFFSFSLSIDEHTESVAISLKIAVICYIYKNLHICDYFRKRVKCSQRACEPLTHNVNRRRRRRQQQQQQRKHAHIFVFELNFKWLSIKLRLNRYEPFHFIPFHPSSNHTNRKPVRSFFPGVVFAKKTNHTKKKGLILLFSRIRLKFFNGLLSYSIS